MNIMLKSGFIRYCIVTCFIFLAGCSAELTDSEYIQRAKKFIENGELQSAVIELKNAIASNPQSGEARLQLGGVYVVVGDGASAEKELLRASELGVKQEDSAVAFAQALLLQGKYKNVTTDLAPDEITDVETAAMVRVYQAQAYLSLGDLRKAEELLAVSSEAIPDVPVLLTTKARLVMIQGQTEDALALLGDVLAAHPKYAQAWSLLGDIQVAQQKHGEALEAYDKAIGFRVNNVQDRLKKIAPMLILGDYSNLKEDVDSLRKIAPDHPFINYADGYVHYQEGDFAAAQTFFEKTNLVLPGYMPANFYLGASYFHQGQLEQAKRYLTLFYKKNPDYGDAVKLLASIHLQLENYTEADKILDLYIKNGGLEDLEVSKLLTALTVMQGDIPASGSLDAVEDYGQEEVVAPVTAMEGVQEGLPIDDPNSAESIARQASEYLNYLYNKEYRKALDAALHMTELRPADAGAWTFVAGAQLGLDDSVAAKKSFEKALEVEPGDINATENFARLLIKEGDSEAAAELYKVSVQHNPGYIKTYINLANLLASQELVSQAIEWMKKAIEANPESLEARLPLVQYYLTSGRFESAIEIMKTNSTLLAKTAVWQHEMGSIYQAGGDFNTALSYYKKRAKLDPSADAHYLLAKTYANLGETKHSDGEIRQALIVDAKHLPSRLIDVRRMMAAKDYSEARASLNELAVLYPVNAEVVAQRGYLALQEGKLAESEKLLLLAETKLPTVEMAIYLAQTYHLQGDNKKSVAKLVEALEKHPDNTKLVFVTANAYLLAGDEEGAISLYTRVLEIDPSHVLSLNNLAALLRERKPTQALAYGEKALELRPDSPHVQDTLAQILLDLGHQARAVALLRSASRSLPKDPSINYHLARVLAKSGKRTEARDILSRILIDDNEWEERSEATQLLDSLN